MPIAAMVLWVFFVMRMRRSCIYNHRRHTSLAPASAETACISGKESAEFRRRASFGYASLRGIYALDWGALFLIPINQVAADPAIQNGERGGKDDAKQSADNEVEMVIAHHCNPANTRSDSISASTVLMS